MTRLSVRSTRLRQRLLIAALVFVPGLTLAQVPPPVAAVALPHRLDARTPQGLRELFRPSAKPLPFVSAHRGGGRKGFPENCIAAFEDTFQHTSAIMEIDPRFTKDGAIVVHHDPTLERTTTGRGRVVDFIRQQGASCMIGTSRNLDLRVITGKVTDIKALEPDYRALLRRGADLIETDIPTLLGPLLQSPSPVPGEAVNPPQR